MAHFYIEPKYNSGERVAGGTLAIYADETMQQLLDLWAYADLQEDEQGGGRLANPVPIDNNGINSSPIFVDLTNYPSAYYVVRDARQAIIRQGYVVPMSWQGGSQPPGGDGQNWNSGDPFWGYEVVTVNKLSTLSGLGRPLFVQGVGAADKSGGLVVWETSGFGVDNVITFASGGTGTIWKARSGYINYSYLESVLGSSVNPFIWLDANYKEQYNIRLDKNATFDLNGTNGFLWKIEKFKDGCFLNLIDSNDTNKAYYIEPSDRIVVDYSWYAINVELYNICQFASSVALGIDNTPTGDVKNYLVDGASKNTLVRIGSLTKGTLEINDRNSGKIYLNSKNVDVKGNRDSNFIYVKSANDINKAVVRFDGGLEPDAYTYYEQNENRWASIYDINEIEDSNVHFGFWMNTPGRKNATPITQRFILENCNVKNSLLNNGMQALVIKNTKITKCDIKGNFSFIGTMTSTTPNSVTYNNFLVMGNDTVVEGCKFWDIMIGLCGNASNTNFSNVLFANNTAMNEHCWLNFWSYTPNGLMATNTTSSTRRFENVRFVGQMRGGSICDPDWSGYGFRRHVINYSSTSQPFGHGHIEITGFYDYLIDNNDSGGSTGPALPTEEFPPWKNSLNYNTKAMANGLPWRDSGYGINELCLVVFGDPLKYTDKDGNFIKVDQYGSMVNTHNSVNDNTSLLNLVTGVDYRYNDVLDNNYSNIVNDIIDRYATGSYIQNAGLSLWPTDLSNAAYDLRTSDSRNRNYPLAQKDSPSNLIVIDSNALIWQEFASLTTIEANKTYGAMIVSGSSYKYGIFMKTNTSGTGAWVWIVYGLLSVEIGYSTHAAVAKGLTIGYNDKGELCINTGICCERLCGGKFYRIRE